MKFCSNCESRLVQSYEDVGGPWVCPKCNPEKILIKMPTLVSIILEKQNSAPKVVVQKFTGMRDSNQIVESSSLLIQGLMNHIDVKALLNQELDTIQMKLKNMQK